MSQMSDVFNDNDSGPESEYEFEDFLQPDANDAAKSTIARIRRKAGLKPPETILKAKIKLSGGGDSGKQ